MTLTDTTERSQFATLSFEFFLDHPPEKVWRALTDPELLAEWLLPVAGLDLQPGTTFTLQAPPVGGWDGVVHCRMLESDRPRKLSYSWVLGDMNTVVTFTLAPTASGTRLSLVHGGWAEAQKKNFGGARYGWKIFGDKLLALLPRMG